jgi:branched-chain amino acid transport system ATP-binding protein
MLLQVESIAVELGGKPVLQGLSLEVDRGEVLALIGPPGSGKSTVLHAVFGLVRATAGRVLLDGQEIANRPPKDNLGDGVVLVPQGGRVFRSLSVHENLNLAAYTLLDHAVIRERMEAVYAFFPRLTDRRPQLAGSLSGGERQMLALGMALMLRPRLLLLDEPSSGLSPILTERVLDQVRLIPAELRSGVLVVEQNVKNALYVGDRVSVMRRGQIVLSASAREEDTAQALLDAYAFQSASRSGTSSPVTGGAPNA